MKIRLNRVQRLSLAKFFYDIAKLSFGALVVAAIAAIAVTGKKAETVLIGTVVTSVEVLAALYLEKEER